MTAVISPNSFPPPPLGGQSQPFNSLFEYLLQMFVEQLQQSKLNISLIPAFIVRTHRGGGGGGGGVGELRMKAI